MMLLLQGYEAAVADAHSDLLPTNEWLEAQDRRHAGAESPPGAASYG